MDKCQVLRIVPHLDSSQALVFGVMEYPIEDGVTIRIGRSTNERRMDKQSMTFRSKVVSRKHAEITFESGKVYIKDVKSSSGTFLNSRRLCAANQVSASYEVQNNDLIQLGIDYKGGTEEVYRCVKMKLEINSPHDDSHQNNQYNINNFNSLRNLYQGNDNEDIHVDECCICLFAIAPYQALFVAPCSHSFHYKCLRPLLSNYPGFLCPLCRKYADLDAPVAVEVEDVKLMLSKINTTVEGGDPMRKSISSSDEEMATSS